MRLIAPADAVPVLSPELQRPDHLATFCDVFARAEAAAAGDGPPVLVLLSAPPQTWKTSTGLHACAWWLARRPADFLALLSYGQDLANDKSREARILATRAGVALRTDSNAADLWRTTSGGGFLARGIEAGVTGHSGLSLVWIDDPFRGRTQAESAAYRRQVMDSIRSVAFTRRHPRTSVLITHTRWHGDDPIGILSREHPGLFEQYTLAACTEDGEPLITVSGRDRAYYAEQRKLVGEYEWHALFMGAPRPREGRLFKGVSVYRETPNDMRIAIGVDFAYSSRTAADWSTAVVLGRSGARKYVLRVVRRQCSATEFAGELRDLARRWPGAPMSAYIGGTEKGTVSLLQLAGVYVQAKPAREDKYTRALRTSSAWNAGEILVPEDEPWVDPFVSEIADFSGTGDDHDDQVDALVSASDALGYGSDDGRAAVQPGRQANRYDGAAERGFVEPTAPALWRPGMGRLPSRSGF